MTVMNAGLQVLLTLNSTLLLAAVYQIKSSFLVGNLAISIQCIIGATLVIAMIIMSWICLAFLRSSRKLSRDEIYDIESIELASNSYLPSYLGYFFVALSIPDLKTLVFVYVLVFGFTLFSNALYFNPVFLLLGYRFYFIRTKAGSKLFLISKTKYRTPAEVYIPSARRINDFTFIEAKEN